MVIDFHAHYPAGDPNFIPGLLQMLPQVGIDRIVLFSAGAALGHAPNEAVLAVAQRHPDKIFAFAYVELGKATPDDVDRFVEQGYHGFKITNPAAPYDDERFFPIYERMAASKLPLLAHTGILMRFPVPRGMRVNSDWMRPIRLDAVVREFPEFNIVGAHLGVPWYEEASMMARVHPNFYVDLTGAWWGGWRANKSTDFYRYHFFWEGAWDKVVFGTDILALQELEPAKKVHDQIVSEVGLSEEVRKRVYGGTACRLLGLSGGTK